MVYFSTKMFAGTLKYKIYYGFYSVEKYDLSYNMTGYTCVMSHNLVYYKSL